MNKYQCHVYCLFHPHEGAPFYFGVTEHPINRKRQHIKTYGKDTYFAILHSFPCSMMARQKETEYIRRYEAKGIVLLNKMKTRAHAKGKAQFSVITNEGIKRLAAEYPTRTQETT